MEITRRAFAKLLGSMGALALLQPAELAALVKEPDHVIDVGLLLDGIDLSPYVSHISFVVEQSLEEGSEFGMRTFRPAGLLTARCDIDMRFDKGEELMAIDSQMRTRIASTAPLPLVIRNGKRTFSVGTFVESWTATASTVELPSAHLALKGSGPVRLS